MQLPNKPQMEERIEQCTTLRTLWENPNQQKSPMKKEVNILEHISELSLFKSKESVYCEDSGYLSTFGGMSSHQRQYLSGTFSVKALNHLTIL